MDKRSILSDIDMSSICENLRSKLGDTKFFVHLLVIVFAISSWADLNGMWMELPLLVLEAPEQWSLPSYITVISQVANIGPIVFVVMTVLMPQSKPKLETYTSIIIIIIGMLSAVLLAFFWQKTSYIGGTEHSTALLILNFFLAIGDCTSSVSFYAFMSLLKPQYMASLFIGEGLSGMLPALIALGQGSGDILCVNKSETSSKTFPNGTEYNVTTYHLVAEYAKPRISVEAFFFTLAAILFLSGVAFVLINTLPYCRSEMVDSNSLEYEYIVPQPNRSQDYGASDYSQLASEDARENEDNVNRQIAQTQRFDMHLRLPDINLCQFVAFLVILVVINLTLTSFLSSIQIYSTLPYGLEPYHLTTTLSAIANPLACFVALFIMTESFAVVWTVTSFGLLGVVYIIYLAVMSPTPPLDGQDAGAVLSVAVWILTTLFLVYAKVCVGGVMRKHGRCALIWAGVATQIGSLIGAMVGFFLVQYSSVFVAADYC